MAVIRRGNSYGVRIWDPVTKKYDWCGTYSDELEARQVELDEKRAVSRRGRETCGEFAARYTRSYNRDSKDGKPRWGRKTVKQIDYALRPFIRSFGSVPLRRFDPAQARPWAQSQPYGYVVIVRTMFNDAIRDGLATSNPFANLRLPQGRGRKDIIVLTEAELEQLIELAERIHGPVFGAIVATAGYVGLRPGELCALEPSDIDIAAKRISIRRAFNGLEWKKPKNEKERRVLLPPPAGQRISRMPRKLGARWLFELPRRNSHFRPASISYYWRPLRTAFESTLPPHRVQQLRVSRKGKEFVFAEMRHTAATILLERGVSPEDVAHQLGHVDGGKLVRERYGHPAEENILGRLEAAFGANVVELREVEDKREEAM